MIQPPTGFLSCLIQYYPMGPCGLWEMRRSKLHKGINPSLRKYITSPPMKLTWMRWNQEIYRVMEKFGCGKGWPDIGHLRSRMKPSASTKNQPLEDPWNSRNVRSRISLDVGRDPIDHKWALLYENKKKKDTIQGGGLAQFLVIIDGHTICAKHFVSCWFSGPIIIIISIWVSLTTSLWVNQRFKVISLHISTSK